MSRYSCFTMPLAAMLVANLIGCGPRLPTTYPVSGTVTLESKPVADAAVQFIPIAGGRPASARTDELGKFRLSTFREGDGALPGKHKVTVQKNKVIGAVVNESGLEGNAPRGELRIEWLVPEKYSIGETSGLMVEVTRGMEPVALTLNNSP